jgi:hypothetical protein
MSLFLGRNKNDWKIAISASISEGTGKEPAFAAKASRDAE